jgi:hypothetical protein
MRLHEADARLEEARLALAEGDAAVTGRALELARRLVEVCGYARREPEVTALEQQLAPQPP